MKPTGRLQDMNAFDELKALRNNASKTIGCFPLYPPLEIFHSMGITPLILWDLRHLINSLDHANKHLQTYACSVSRRLIEFICSAPDGLIDAIFMYNACDTLRNLPEIINSCLQEKVDKPRIFKMHVPMAPQQQTETTDYLYGRITALIRELEESFGLAFSQEKFLHSIALYRKMRLLNEELEKMVAQGLISYNLFSLITRKGFFAKIENHIEEMESVVANHSLSPKNEYAPPTASVIISGILPPPASLIDALENYEIRIVGNDIATQRRSYAYTPGDTGDPCLYYRDFYRHHFPCPTLLYTGDQRLAAIKNLIYNTRARGLIFIGEKFCEYEYFEIPYLEKKLKEMGIFTLHLEISVDDDSGANYVTRLEAFAELLKT